MVDPTCEYLRRYKLGGNEFSKLRCGNAGENKKLNKKLNPKDQKLNGEFEHSQRSTIQHNH